MVLNKIEKDVIEAGMNVLRNWSFTEKYPEILDLLEDTDYDYNKGLVYNIDDSDMISDVFGTNLNMDIIHMFIADVGLKEYWFENENPIVAYTENPLSDKHFLTESEARQLCDDILEDALEYVDGFDKELLDWFETNL